MSARDRLSATIESHLLDAGRRAVAEGRAETLSGWVNEALRRQAEHEQRLRAADEFVRAYEARYGKITDEEIERATRDMRARAVVVRGRKSRPARPKRRTA